MQGQLAAMLAPVMIYFALGSAAYLALRGEYIRGLDYRVVDGVTLQSDSFGCVPSSLATVLRQYGLEHSEGELGFALRTTSLPTRYHPVRGLALLPIQSQSPRC